MAQTYLNAGDKITLTSGAVMTAGPRGSVIDSHIFYDTVREGFSLPSNAQRTGEPYGVIEEPSSNGSAEPSKLFDVYLDMDTNLLWYESNNGFSPTPVADCEHARPAQSGLAGFIRRSLERFDKSAFKAAIDAFPDKCLELMIQESGSETPVRMSKTLDEVKTLIDDSDCKVIVAEQIEVTLINHLWRQDTMLMNMVLSMLSTRVRAVDEWDGDDRFEIQLAELDRHVSALSLYGLRGEEVTDLPVPRENIESLMKLPRLVAEIFSQAGYSTTIYIPYAGRNSEMLYGFEAFNQRTGITLEIVQPA